MCLNDCLNKLVKMRLSKVVPPPPDPHILQFSTAASPIQTNELRAIDVVAHQRVFQPLSSHGK